MAGSEPTSFRTREHDVTPITLLAQKYNRAPHMEWPATMVAQTASRTVCYAGPQTVVTHHSKGVQFALGRHALCVYEPDAWFNTLFDFDDRGDLLEIYCNVALPYELNAGLLTWVDLDLDVVLTPESSAFVADEEEFIAHAARFGYPEEVVSRARETVSLLLDRYHRRAFPFEWRKLDAALAGLDVRLAGIEELPGH